MTTDQSTAIRRAAAACLILLLPVVSGCLPFYTLTDYTPEMADGTLKVGHCLGTRKMQYVVDGVIVRSGLLVYPHARKNMPQLTLAFDIPAGRTVELVTPAILLVYAPGTAATSVNVAGFSSGDVPAQQLDALPQCSAVTGVPVSACCRANSGPASGCRGEPVGDVRAELPDIRVNGRLFKIPSIDFRRKPRVELMVPLNC
jgi:hypothetical protein